VATFQAIAATGQAILGLLADAVPKPEFAAARFELYQVSNFRSPMEEGVSLYLYRISTNTTQRNLPPRVGTNGRRYRPPIPLDLHYMVSVWARTAVKQQRLLGWVVRTLEDIPILPAGMLNNFGPEAEIFRPGETVEVIFDQMTLQDLYNLWSAIKVSPPLSVNYLVRMIAVESSVELVDAAAVQTRVFDTGKVTS
jgi:hypothetical protein